MSLSAVLLNGLVALPFAFAVLTRLLDRRGSDSPRVAVLGGALTFAWSVWAYVDSSAVLDGPPSTTPGSPSSACAGTSAWTGSAARWC